ncbi:MAG TPA: FAD-dependent oxidoreductase [Rhodanobacteraceae bacterium]
MNTTPTNLPRASHSGYDVVIIGAGVFGLWTAHKLHAMGKRVAVIDAAEPAHALAASSGESRVARCGYGDREIYAEWAWQSLGEWRALAERAKAPLFQATGVLWVHKRHDEDVAATARVLARYEIPFQTLNADELRRRYPFMRVDDDESGFMEPAGGALMARRAIRFLAAELASGGVTFLRGRVMPVRGEQGLHGALPAVTTHDGQRIEAGQFVFACGSWLDRACPQAMAKRLAVTRQEVCFFDVGEGATGKLPVWADLPFYGFPRLDGRGFKVACHQHGPAMDPDTSDREVGKAGEDAARAFLARRFPALAEAPLSAGKVCQYANTLDGHFVIDQHPGLDNVWLVGGGSGHGFKHGPAVGRHAAELVAGVAVPRDPFRLVTKPAQGKPSVD